MKPQILDTTFSDKRFVNLTSVTIVAITSDSKLVNATAFDDVLKAKLPKLVERQEIRTLLRTQMGDPQWNERARFVNGSYEGMQFILSRPEGCT